MLNADYVIAVAIDGLRPDAITTLGAAELPNYYRMINEGSWTANARADYPFTLPGHAAMLTSRPVSGHGVSFNSDNDSTIHAAAGRYVTSVFDIVHDNGLRTGFYASKSKFSFFVRSWSGTYGRSDPIAPDNGRDKIDVAYYDPDTSSLTSSFVAAMEANPFHYSMIALRDPDYAGHTAGWMSGTYLSAVRATDSYLGQILNLVTNNPALDGRTTIILTADHGEHRSSSAGYTIPLLAWGAGVMAGGDLYAMNPNTRSDPGTDTWEAAGPHPSIHQGDLANLATQLLGLGVVDGSFFNNSHDLALSDPAAADTMPPTSSVGALSAYYSMATVSIPFTAADIGGTGVSSVTLWYRSQPLDGGTWGEWTQYGGVVTSSPITFDSSTTGGDGQYEFYTRATDNATNTETAPGVSRRCHLDRRPGRAGPRGAAPRHSGNLPHSFLERGARRE